MSVSSLYSQTDRYFPVTKWKLKNWYMKTGDLNLRLRSILYVCTVYMYACVLHGNAPKYVMQMQMENNHLLQS